MLEVSVLFSWMIPLWPKCYWARHQTAVCHFFLWLMIMNKWFMYFLFFTLKKYNYDCKSHILPMVGWSLYILVLNLTAAYDVLKIINHQKSAVSAINIYDVQKCKMYMRLLAVHWFLQSYINLRFSCWSHTWQVYNPLRPVVFCLSFLQSQRTCCTYCLPLWLLLKSELKSIMQAYSRWHLSFNTVLKQEFLLCK